MKTISMKKHIGKDGLLNISIPTGETETDVDIVVIIESTKRGNEWDDFFDQTYGCFSDNEIVRPEQGVYTEREKLL